KEFLDYDQEALDRAYDQSVYAPNREQLLARLAHTSELVRRRLGPPDRHAYGDAAIEGLDLYRTKAERAPINVFVHGGAWRAGLARDYAFAAEMFVRAGAHYAALDFNSVIETGGDLLPMAEQVRRGIAWVCKNAERLGADPRRVYVSGTSSGAHLAGVAATTDWTRYGLAAEPIRGYTLASGMYDLHGPRLSKRSAYVRFTDAAEQALSPQRHLGAVRAPIVLLYGSLETPEFQRQTREFADALTDAGKPCELIRAEGYNHFELTETLGNPYGPLGRAVLAQMKLNSGTGT
ncbi:MAG TPA: alpha/beta hydrolase, partial [Burkholderiales bacterium]|nr:alpha/beta hydrolase [Burkholderiales bacterium]